MVIIDTYHVNFVHDFVRMKVQCPLPVILFYEIYLYNLENQKYS